MKFTVWTTANCLIVSLTRDENVGRVFERNSIMLCKGFYLMVYNRGWEGAGGAGMNDIYDYPYAGTVIYYCRGVVSSSLFFRRRRRKKEEPVTNWCLDLWSELSDGRCFSMKLLVKYSMAWYGRQAEE